MKTKYPFEDNFTEYKEYVQKHLQIPTNLNEGYFKRGSRMSSWRAHILNSARNHNKFVQEAQSIIEFESSMAGAIDSNSKHVKLENKYMALIKSWNQKCICNELLINKEAILPLETYLQRFNRFQTYSPGLYVLIAKELELDKDIVRFIELTLDSYGLENYPNWTKWHDSFNIVTLPDQILSVLSTLDEREELLMKMYYGFNDGVCRSLNEIGEYFEITGSRASQIRRKCLRKLRHHTRSRQIKRIIIREKIKIVRVTKYMRGSKIEKIDNTEITPDIIDIGVDMLSLSVRAYNCLIRAGIRTLGDLIQLDKDSLFQLRNLGKRSYEEIIDAVESLGLEFGVIIEGDKES